MRHEALKLKVAARELRRFQTDAEEELWRIVRNRGLDGLKFRRQCEIGRYIVDFYCEELKLAIELDGAPHFDPAILARDNERALWLQNQGITIIRIENEELMLNASFVLARIERVVAELRILAQS